VRYIFNLVNKFGLKCNMEIITILQVNARETKVEILNIIYIIYNIFKMRNTFDNKQGRTL